MSHEWAKALVASVVLIALTFVALPITDWRAESRGVESFDAEPANPGSASEPNPGNLTAAIFGWTDASGFHPGYVLPFEVLSVLLLGALIAALYVGAKTKREFGGGPK